VLAVRAPELPVEAVWAERFVITTAALRDARDTRGPPLPSDEFSSAGLSLPVVAFFGCLRVGVLLRGAVDLPGCCVAGFPGSARWPPGLEGCADPPGDEVFPLDEPLGMIRGITWRGTDSSDGAELPGRSTGSLRCCPGREVEAPGVWAGVEVRVPGLRVVVVGVAFGVVPLPGRWLVRGTVTPRVCGTSVTGRPALRPTERTPTPASRERWLVARTSCCRSFSWNGTCLPLRVVSIWISRRAATLRCTSSAIWGLRATCSGRILGEPPTTTYCFSMLWMMVFSLTHTVWTLW